MGLDLILWDLILKSAYKDRNGSRFMCPKALWQDHGHGTSEIIIHNTDAIPGPPTDLLNGDLITRRLFVSVYVAGIRWKSVKLVYCGGAIENKSKQSNLDYVVLFAQRIRFVCRTEKRGRPHVQHINRRRLGNRADVVQIKQRLLYCFLWLRCSKCQDSVFHGIPTDTCIRARNEV